MGNDGKRFLGLGGIPHENVPPALGVVVVVASNAGGSGGTSSGTDDDDDGYATPSDCADDDPDVNPGATEVCNEVDDNCDGEIDEGVTQTFYRDADGDGHGSDDPAKQMQACSQPDGYRTGRGGSTTSVIRS